MKHMRKGIALLLAAMMVMPNMPASAENVQSETQTEEVADVTETTEKAAQNVEETQVQEEIESADDASVFYNTGNYEVGIMEDDFAEDGSYTINIPEENPFFPYEVQFTCDGEVTDEWFMTPDDTVEIGGHTFKVSAYFDNTVVTQMSLNVAGDTVTVYPEKKEFTNDGDGTMEMSLLPLTQRNLTVDLTGYTPIELTMVSTDSIFTGANALKNTDKIAWKDTTNTIGMMHDYNMSSVADTIDVSYLTYIGESDWEFIVGTADQLDENDICYKLKIISTVSDKWLEPVYFDENNQKMKPKEYVYRDDSLIIGDNIWGRDLMVVLPEEMVNYEADENYCKVAFKINDSTFAKKQYDEIRVFEGLNKDVQKAISEQDITDEILLDDTESADGYNNEIMVDHAITLVSYKNGKPLSCLPMFLNVGAYKFSYTVSEQGMYTGTGDYTIYQSEQSESNGVQYILNELQKGYSADGIYSLKLAYGTGDIFDSSENKKVTAAYEGYYATMQDAQSANAVNIRDELFCLNGKDGYARDFSGGITFSIFVGDDGSNEQKRFYYNVKNIEGAHEVTESFGYTTDIEFTGVVDREGNDVAAYVMPSDYDSYAAEHYLTILVKEGTDVKDVAPKFSLKSKGERVYAENSSNQEVSGKNYHDFSNGTVQYTVISEDGEYTENYWLQVVAVEDTPNLYINSFADAQSKTRVENGVIYSEREVEFLDKVLDCAYYDIVLANMSTKEIQNLNVELDSELLVLDDYWNLNGKYALQGVTDEAELRNGTLSNLARIRLEYSPDIDWNNYDGESITGTLTVKSGKATLAVLNLTGSVFSPNIMTNEIPQAVKYVPYGTMLQNNIRSWRYSAKYSLEDGKLPDGMEIRENGEIYGVPKESGEYEFTVGMSITDHIYNTTRKERAIYVLKVLENTDENIENATDIGYELRERLRNIVIGTDIGFQTLVSIGELDEFQAVYLDGQELTKGSDYSAERGSTRITISTQTLSRGGKGSHTIALEFRQKDTDTLKRAAQNYIVSDEKANSGNNSSNGNSGNSGNSSGGSSSGGNSNGGSSTSNVTATNGTVSQTEKDSQIVKQKTITYMVAAGDTLSKIALKMYGDRKFWRKIYADNKDVLKNPNRIYVGQRLTLYFDLDETQNQSDADATVKTNTYVIKPGDTLWKIATKLYNKGYYWKNIYEANRKTIKSPERIRVGQMIELP